MQQSFDDFEKQWISQRVADPSLGSVGMPAIQWYQCVSLIKQYLRQCYGIEAGFWGNAIDYWTIQRPELQAKFDYLPIQEVAKGDIVPLKTLGHDDYTEPGHIVIGTGSENSSQFEALEQNGQTGTGTGLNGDAIRTRWIDKSRIAGVIRYRPEIQAPTHYELTVARTLLVTKDPTTWYNLTDNSTAASLPINTPFPAYGLATKPDGSKYFMIQADFGNADTTGIPVNNNGVSMSDVKELPPPVVPYVPPAAPVPVKKLVYYELLTTVPTYPDATSAWVRATVKTNGSFPAGKDYILFGTDEHGMEQIGITNMGASVWVNPKDNVALPAVVTPEEKPATPVAEPATNTDWKSTYKPFYPTASELRVTRTRTYIVQMNGTTHDLAHVADYDINLTRGEKVQIAGTFTGPDGKTRYYRLVDDNDTDWNYFWDVPISYNGRAVLILPPVTFMERWLHRGEKLNSIFSEDIHGATKFIDSIQLNLFKKRK